MGRPRSNSKKGTVRVCLYCGKPRVSAGPWDRIHPVCRKAQDRVTCHMEVEVVRSDRRQNGKSFVK